MKSFTVNLARNLKVSDFSNYLCVKSCVDKWNDSRFGVRFGILANYLIWLLFENSRYEENRFPSAVRYFFRDFIWNFAKRWSTTTTRLTTLYQPFNSKCTKCSNRNCLGVTFGQEFDGQNWIAQRYVDTWNLKIFVHGYLLPTPP